VKKLLSLVALAAFVFVIGCNDPAKTTSARRDITPPTKSNIPDKTSSDRPLDKPSTDKPSTDKPSTDKPSTDKPSTDKPNDKKPTDK
jgi:hypothetical protein